MTRLLMRAHVWVHDVQASRRVRVVLTVLLAVLVITGAVVVSRVGFDLRAQRAGLVTVLRGANLKEGTAAGVQLVERRTVTANDREYGGARIIPNPVDLFNSEGALDRATQDDLAWRLVLPQVPAWMPFILVESPVATLVFAGLVLAAVISLVWLGLGGHLLEWGLLLACATGVCWLLEWGTMLRALIGMGALALLFAVLWKLLSAALAVGGPLPAVARITMLEGVRSLAAIGFAAPIVVLLPILALSRDPDQGLYQAIPGFLDWGHTAVYASAALLVILFGCGTTAFEIRDRQVWSVLTKPVSRLGWMAGKWLGTLVLGASLLAGGGVALYVGAHYMAALPPISEQDARDVRNTVLVGRIGTSPALESLSRARLIEIVDEVLDSDASLKAEIAAGRRDLNSARQEIAVQRHNAYLDEQRRVKPGEHRDYKFYGLGAAASGGRPLSLRYEMHAGANDTHQKYPMLIAFESGQGGPQWDIRWWTPGETYSYEVDPAFISADGTLTVRLYNAGVDDTVTPPQPFAGPLTMYFEADGLEVLYADTSFASNLCRALLVDLAKIGFLAALAIASATLLSFPVAVLMSFGIYAMATLTPFLEQSLRLYHPDDTSGWFIWAFQWAVKGVASGIGFALQAFAQRAPSDDLAQGRAITGSSLLMSLGVIGMLWTGATLGFGWLVARRKEVAVYSGQS